MRNRAISNVAATIISFVALAVTGYSKDVKLKAEELIARHLASIGTTEARSAVKNRGLSGAAQAIFRLGSQGQLSGKANVLSEGRMVRVGMNFGALEYPGEQIAFDGNKVTVGQIRPGQRSPLSEFLYQYDVVVKEGLFAGALSTAWPLLDIAGRQPKLDYSGLKKVEGKQTHELKYKARKGMGDVQISLFFDPETYRHVRSQYRVVVPATMSSTPAESAGQRDTIYTIVEEFTDFKEVDGLTLPHAYSLELTIEGQRATILTQWNITAAQLAHNQQFDPKSFAVN